jgi:hypothetical protein
MSIDNSRLERELSDAFRMCDFGKAARHCIELARTRNMSFGATLKFVISLHQLGLEKEARDVAAGFVVAANGHRWFVPLLEFLAGRKTLAETLARATTNEER